MPLNHSGEWSPSLLKQALKTPAWGTFFYFANSREALITIYERFLDAGFTTLEQPHALDSETYIAHLMDHEGHEVLLRSH